MNFLSPAWLWSLLSLVPIIAVYFLKVRPRRKPTNAYFLWEKILAEKQSAALFRKLRDLLSLILLILVAAAIAFALARPQIAVDDERDLLIVIDVSASMEAADKSSVSRLDLARDKAKSLVRAMNGSKRMAVATISDSLDFSTHLSDSPKDLLEAIDEMAVRAAPLRDEAVKSLSAFSLSGDEASHRVILITDGCGDLSELPEGVEVIQIESAGKNLGVTAADLQWIPGRPESASLFVKISSSYSEVKSVEMELRHQDTGVLSKLAELQVKPGMGEGVTFEIDSMDPGPWVLELKHEDSLSSDNLVNLALNPQRPIRVQVDADDPYFFQRCIESFALSGGLLVPGGGAGSLTVAVGKAPKVGSALVFSPSGKSSFWKSVGDPVAVGVVEVVKKGHPVIEHTDLSGVAFEGAKQIELPEGAVVIAESDDRVPLIYKVQTAEQTVVVINLDPSAANFFLSPWFPVLVYDAAIHLAGREVKLASIYPVGAELDLLEASSVTSPSGEALRTGEKVRLTELGVYQASLAGQNWWVGSGLLSETESLLEPREDLREALDLASGHPVPVWLLILALCAVLVETLLYHRRKAG